MADDNEELLYKMLLDPKRYEKDVRPTKHHIIPTNITFGFLLNQIVEMDERNQILTTRSWLNINWLDPRLTWNESEWDGINILYIPYQRVWKPDIILVNNAVSQYFEATVSTDIMATSSGNVTWLYSAIFKSSCQIKVRYYPFDDQECELRFASWSHDLKEMDLGLITGEGDLSNYMNNSEFDLIDMTARKEIIKFPTEASQRWPVIIIRIRMHRRPLFYVFNHILPCVLISSMAVLGFFMPPQSGEKINMCITTILSMGVYLQSITELIPPTSEAVPLIGMYYVASLFMVCLATSINVITLNIYRSSAADQGIRIPRWMQKYILGYLAKLISVHEPDSIKLLKSSSQNNTSTRRIFKELNVIRRIQNEQRKTTNYSSECECFKRSLIRCSDSLRSSTEFYEFPQSPYSLPIDDSKNMNILPSGMNFKQSIKPVFSETDFSDNLMLGCLLTEQRSSRQTIPRPQVLHEFDERFRALLKRIYRSLQQHEIREKVIDERRRIQWQWQQLATVVDRLLLVIFSVITISTVVFFLILPVTFRDTNSQSAFIL